MRRAKLNALFRCSNSRANISPVTVPNEVPPIPFESNQTRKNFPRTSRLKEIHHRRRHHPGRRLAAVFRAGQGVAAGYLSRRAPSIRRPTCFCWSWTVFRSSAPRRKSMCVARTARWKSAPSPARAAAEGPRTKTALEKELLADPKERAEHVMLVDLARNDIGRVCDFGSVQVKDLMFIRALQPRHAHRVAGRGEIIRR
jgi:hypothetical protein